MILVFYHYMISQKKQLNELKSQEINKINEYPLYSPDFNAIERIWKIMKDTIEKKMQ